MRKDDISRLLARYLSMQEEGKDVYFDADEIEDLLDSFEDSDDYTLYDGVLALGIKLHPDHPGLKIKQCKLLVYNEEYEKALTLIDAIGENDEPELDLLRLECYCSLDRYPDAVAYTEQLISKDCEYLVDIFEYTAPILGELGMHEEAIAFIRRGQAFFPDNIELKEELCYNLESVGRTKEAISICNELIDDNPYSFDDWTTLGRLYSLETDYDKAIEAFDFALTCDDTDNEVKILKAYCLFMNENYQKAIEVYEELLEDEEYRFRVKPLMAECYLKLDNFEEAYTLLRDTLDKNKQYEEPASYINYLLCCAKLDRLEEEQDILDTALEIFPQNINLLYLKSLYFMDQGEDDKAIELLEHILKQIEASEMNVTGLTDTYFQLGNLFLKKRNIAKALSLFLQILDLVPTYPSVHLKIAICYLELKDTTKFMEHITQCTDQEIIDFEGNYILPTSEKNKSPLIDLIKDYINNKKNKQN